MTPLTKDMTATLLRELADAVEDGQFDAITTASYLRRAADTLQYSPLPAKHALRTIERRAVPLHITSLWTTPKE